MTLVVIYQDEYQISDLTTGDQSYIQDFGDEHNAHGGGTYGDSVAHFTDLNWTNPNNTQVDSIYLFSSLTNDTSSAVIRKTFSKSTTNYEDVLGNETHRFYWLKAKYQNGFLSPFSPVAVDTTTVYVPNTP